MTTSHRAVPPPAALAAVLLAAAWPQQASGVTPNRSVAAALVAAEAGRPGLWLAAATWLEGDVEVVASLGWRSAGRTSGRSADGTLEPAAGLRWALDRPGLRPEASAELGCRWRAGAWRAAALGGAVRAGLEWLPGRAAGLGLGAGLRWAAGSPVALELSVAARIYF